MSNLFDLSGKEDEEKEKHRTVVRLVTSAWLDKRGAHIQKQLRFLKRKSCGFNCLEEDCKNVGADEALRTVINLFDVKDGIYDLVMVNERRDWETGYVEEWEFMLYPFTS